MREYIYDCERYGIKTGYDKEEGIDIYQLVNKETGVIEFMDTALPQIHSVMIQFNQYVINEIEQDDVMISKEDFPNDEGARH